ncbi:hypothetical protein ACFLZN_01665 [Nanoarchaeota archaeon]
MKRGIILVLVLLLCISFVFGYSSSEESEELKNLKDSKTLSESDRGIISDLPLNAIESAKEGYCFKSDGMLQKIPSETLTERFQFVVNQPIKTFFVSGPETYAFEITVIPKIGGSNDITAGTIYAGYNLVTTAATISVNEAECIRECRDSDMGSMFDTPESGFITEEYFPYLEARGWEAVCVDIKSPPQRADAVSGCYCYFPPAYKEDLTHECDHTPEDVLNFYKEMLDEILGIEPETPSDISPDVTEDPGGEGACAIVSGRGTELEPLYIWERWGQVNGIGICLRCFLKVGADLTNFPRCGPDATDTTSDTGDDTPTSDITPADTDEPSNLIGPPDATPYAETIIPYAEPITTVSPDGFSVVIKAKEGKEILTSGSAFTTELYKVIPTVIPKIATTGEINLDFIALSTVTQISPIYLDTGKVLLGGIVPDCFTVLASCPVREGDKCKLKKPGKECNSDDDCKEGSKCLVVGDEKKCLNRAKENAPGQLDTPAPRGKSCENGGIGVGKNVFCGTLENVKEKAKGILDNLKNKLDKLKDAIGDVDYTETDVLITAEGPDCIDSDEKEPEPALVKGVVNYVGMEERDYCRGESLVWEHFCSDDELDSILVNCSVVLSGSICSDGRCVVPEKGVCYDTDISFIPNEKFHLGSVIYNSNRFIDYCNRITSVIEQSCVDGVPKSSEEVCDRQGTGFCDDGKCVEGDEVEEKYDELDECFDSDADAIVPESVPGIVYDDSFWYDDFCDSDKSMHEFSCSDNDFVETLVNCGELITDSICSDGRCVVPEKGVCYDTDISFIPNEKFHLGSVIYNDDRFVDYCKSINTVIEQVCHEGVPKSLEEDCGTENFCYTGKCVEYRGVEDKYTGKDKCFDSDGDAAIPASVPGAVYNDQFWRFDDCESDNSVKEYSCSNDAIVETLINCEEVIPGSICVGERCIKE